MESQPAPGDASNAAVDDAAQRIAAPMAAGDARSAREPRPLKISVRRAFCQKDAHYVGPPVVTADGVVVAARELIDQLPLEVVAPAHAAKLVFTAPGLSPGTRGVVVFDGNDALETARELPLGAGDFVVVD